jgi:hypothetical protein
MKAGVKRLVTNERGHIVMVVLILLVIGGLILAPMLGLMTTGLGAGQVYEKKTDELYAADAGVEDAVWKIQQGDVPVCPGNPTWSYNMSDVNGKSVEVTITWASNLTYQVLSTATGNGSGTQIEAYIVGISKFGDYSGLMQHILTSPGEIDVANKVVLEYPEGAEPYPAYPNPWPEVCELEEFYGEQVANATSYYSNTVIDIQGVNTQLGPLYVDGTLEIKNSSGTPATLNLTGTFYSTGNTLIGQNGKDFTLDLNGHTIFVSSNSTGSQPALIVGGKCIVKGPGILVATGDIELKPDSQLGEQDGGGPVFVLSVSGTSYVQPSGHVYGSIAGKVEVYVQQGEKPVITYPPGGFDEYGLNFLIGIQKLVHRIATWEINPV